MHRNVQVPRSGREAGLDQVRDWPLSPPYSLVGVPGVSLLRHFPFREMDDLPGEGVSRLPGHIAGALENMMSYCGPADPL